MEEVPLVHDQSPRGEGENDGEEGDEDRTKKKKEELRKTEEMMELAALMGRAVFLERMLRAGKRVSGRGFLILSDAVSGVSSIAKHAGGARARPDKTVVLGESLLSMLPIDSC